MHKTTDEQHKSFQRAVAGACALGLRVENAPIGLNLSNREFEAWARGDKIPHPSKQTDVLEWVAGQINRMEKICEL